MTHFRIRELDGYVRSPEDEAYFQMIVEARKAIPKKPASTEQCASTKRILERDPKDDLAWQMRTLDVAAATASTDAEAVFADTLKGKPGRLADYSHVESIRQQSKNELGQSEKHFYGDESRREKAIDAFLFTPPAPLSQVDMQKVESLTKIEEYKGTTIETKESLWTRFKNMFKKEETKNRAMIELFSKEEQEEWSKLKK